jgi:hypothetical protein
MEGIAGWAKDLLMSRGALVDPGHGGSLTAMVPQTVAKELECDEWLSLKFGSGAGCDDETEWLERLARLLPAAPRAAAARPTRTSILRRIDPAGAIERDLVLQNGIYRAPEERQATARYFLFQFLATVESDETGMSLCTACLNATANSVVPRPNPVLRFLREEAEDDPDSAVPSAEAARLFPIALSFAKAEARTIAATVAQNANRRLARDSDRIYAYYADLLKQIEKRIARHKGDEKAAEKERSRAAATAADRAAKLEDAARKYAVKIRIEPGDAITILLPVREIAVRLIRKKVERQAIFHFNPLLGALESPWCEGCGDRAHPLYLCDDRAHYLCPNCQSPCPACGRQFCRACRPKCKCRQ